VVNVENSIYFLSRKMHKNEHEPSVKSVSRYLEWKEIWSEEKQGFKNLTILTSLWPSIKSNQIGLLAPNKQQQTCERT